MGKSFDTGIFVFHFSSHLIKMKKMSVLLKVAGNPIETKIKLKS